VVVAIEVGEPDLVGQVRGQGLVEPSGMDRGQGAIPRWRTVTYARSPLSLADTSALPDADDHVSSHTSSNVDPPKEGIVKYKITYTDGSTEEVEARNYAEVNGRITFVDGDGAVLAVKADDVKRISRADLPDPSTPMPGIG
jgi:hypothetical protein